MNARSVLRDIRSMPREAQGLYLRGLVRGLRASAQELREVVAPDPATRELLDRMAERKEASASALADEALRLDLGVGEGA